jgi:hypothetical protein
MAEESAGIWLKKEAEDAFYALPAESQVRLAAFLEALRAELESTGGGRKEYCLFEWEPGFVVYWDVNLKPKYRDANPKLKMPAKLGSAYRIEVLEIRRFV